MPKKKYTTPMLDQLEGGPWPSFVTALKHLADRSEMMSDLLRQLEHAYETKKGYWKGGTVRVFGYGAGLSVRAAMSCVGSARRDYTCYNGARVHRTVLNRFTDDLHRLALQQRSTERCTSNR